MVGSLDTFIYLILSFLKMKKHLFFTHQQSYLVLSVSFHIRQFILYLFNILFDTDKWPYFFIDRSLRPPFLNWSHFACAWPKQKEKNSVKYQILNSAFLLSTGNVCPIGKSFKISSISTDVTNECSLLKTKTQKTML